MHINGIPVLYAGQRYGANYSAPYPGEHVRYYFSLYHAREELALDPFSCSGDTILLWKVSPHDSEAEVISATLTDAAEADYLVEMGPRGGVKSERI